MHIYNYICIKLIHIYVHIYVCNCAYIYTHLYTLYIRHVHCNLWRQIEYQKFFVNLFQQFACVYMYVCVGSDVCVDVCVPDRVH